MDKYKVLLVDDEEEAIEAIRLKLEWETLGFEVIGSANNGVKALELVERLQPDVVITDIKMPYMDGLELARALNEDYQNIHIIIFTGFDEFEYAKEAVHLEIEEYMLKPINSQELSECLKRLKKTLDNEREEKLNVKKLEHYFNASLPMFQTNLFISLIEGRITEADCEKFLAADPYDRATFWMCRLSYFRTSCAGRDECIAVIHVGRAGDPGKDRREMEKPDVYLSWKYSACDGIKFRRGSGCVYG